MDDPRGNYNGATSWPLDEDEERLGREWLGYGSLDAPYWFVGLEPGGRYDPLFARFWIDKLDAAPVFDPRLDARIEPNLWFLPGSQSQRTWKPLIEVVLGFTGRGNDELEYQRNRFGCAPPIGEIAAIELSAFAARGGGSSSAHRFTYLSDRIATIRNAITAKQPRFILFYGTSQRTAFGAIAGGFDNDGFKFVGKTLCALVRHPKARGLRQDWRKLGMQLRARTDARERT